MERREMTEAGREQGCEGKDTAALERSLRFIPSVRGGHQRASDGEFRVLIYIIKKKKKKNLAGCFWEWREWVGSDQKLWRLL